MNDIDVIQKLALQIQPQVKHICDYFEKENIDGRLGEMSTIWIVALSLSNRCNTPEELENSIKIVTDLIGNLARFMFATMPRT